MSKLKYDNTNHCFSFNTPFLAPLGALISIVRRGWKALPRLWGLLAGRGFKLGRQRLRKVDLSDLLRQVDLMAPDGRGPRKTMPTPRLITPGTVKVNGVFLWTLYERPSKGTQVTPRPGGIR
jgi:hypothetical protein